MQHGFRWSGRPAAALAGLCLSLSAGAQAGPDAAALSGEQTEADYRVIAARCGTPGFERAFYNQSRAAVAAGLVARDRPAAAVEKTITALRRSPLVLVPATSDCAAQVVMLRQVQKERAAALHAARQRPRTAAN